jgi:hypothetical protein
VIVSFEVLCAQSARVDDISVAQIVSVLSAARIGVQMEPKVNKLRMLHGVTWMGVNNKSDNEKNSANLQWVGFNSLAWTS